MVSTKRAIDNYCNADPSFATQRECKFLNTIADAFDAGDAEEFTAAVADYDRFVREHRIVLGDARLTETHPYRLTHLDAWKTGLLLTIKRNIAEEPGLV